MVGGVSGEGVRRRRREYTEDLEETRTEESTATEVVREKLRTCENSESDEQSEVSVSEAMEQAIKELQEEEKREREVPEKLKEALDELQMEEQEGKPTGERLKEVLDELEMEELESKSTEDKLKESLKDLDEPIEEIEETKVQFTSLEEIQRAHQQHEHLEREMTPESLEKYEQYIRVINENPEVTDKEIADREKLSESIVENWRAGKTYGPSSYLRGLEQSRLEHENNVSEEALEHRIEPEDVKEVTAKVLEQKERTIKELTGVVEDLYKRIDNPELNSVHYAELYDNEKTLMNDRLREMGQEIRAHREDIETELNRRMGYDVDHYREIRVAVTDNRLYYWHVDNSPDRWLNVLADQKFYIAKEDKLRLIDETIKHLHVRGGGETSEYYLNDMLGQLTRLDDPAINRVQRYGSRHYLDGETMHFVADVRQQPDEFKYVTKHMGISHRGRVENLKWPEIREFRMKTYAIIDSDGTLSPKGQLRYFEKNDARRNLVVEIFQEFGDFKVKEYREAKGKSEVVRIELPMVFGTMMKSWGIPEGDKAIHNKGLHESVINESLHIKVHYPREMVPEDGSISGNRISVTRHNVLHAGKKEEMYRNKFGIEPLVNQDHIDLVREHGDPQRAHLHYKEGEVIRLYRSKIDEIAEEGNDRVSHAAKDLLRIISENKNRLLSDEVEHILEPLGIEIRHDAYYVQYFSKSQRLALSSTADTKTKDAAIRWVLIAPPNHPIKMDTAIELIKSDKIRCRKIAKQIELDGLSVHPIWEEYLEWMS